ncbi:MAG: TRAP transporter small permease [Spirochaetales bacterium]
MIRKIGNLLAGMYSWFVIILVVGMFIVVGLNVFSRYVLNASLGWADELARFLFIWVSLLGAVMAFASSEHVGLDILVERVPHEGMKNVLVFLSHLAVLGALIVYTVSGWEVAVSADNVSPALYIPMTAVYAIMPISGILMIAMSLQKLARLMTRRNK